MTQPISRQIRAARIFMGWSREQFAEKAGVCPDTIRNIETDQHRPYGRTLKRVMAVIETHQITFPIIGQVVAREIL